MKQEPTNEGTVQRADASEVERQVRRLEEELRREKQLFEMECATHRHDLAVMHEARSEACRYRDVLERTEKRILSGDIDGALVGITLALIDA